LTLLAKKQITQCREFAAPSVEREGVLTHLGQSAIKQFLRCPLFSPLSSQMFPQGLQCAAVHSGRETAAM
jgi:hypothetical protein